MTQDDLIALHKFTEKYPTWWYKIGVCDLTRDFDCAPQGHSPEFEFIKDGCWPDDCFQCDHTGTVADAINQVMEGIDYAVKNKKWVYFHSRVFKT